MLNDSVESWAFMLVIYLMIAVLFMNLITFYYMMRKDKKIPWIRTPINKIRMLLGQSPQYVYSWEHASHVQVFHHDRRMIIALMHGMVLRPNTIICVGQSAASYDKFMIAGPIHKYYEDLYSLDVDYLGPDSTQKGVKITYSL